MHLIMKSGPHRNPQCGKQDRSRRDGHISCRFTHTQISGFLHAHLLLMFQVKWKHVAYRTHEDTREPLASLVQLPCRQWASPLPFR